jgi:hypothetical protein
VIIEIPPAGSRGSNSIEVEFPDGKLPPEVAVPWLEPVMDAVSVEPVAFELPPVVVRDVPVSFGVLVVARVEPVVNAVVGPYKDMSMEESDCTGILVTYR